MEIGTPVVYRRTKHSRSPGPRAAVITPAKHGDSYSYVVDKFWVVVERLSSDEIVVMTRRGKQLTLNPDDPNLRRANLFERLMHHKRFPKLATNDPSIDAVD